MKSLFFVDQDQTKIQLLQKAFGEDFTIEGFSTGTACLERIKELENLNEDLPEVIIIDYGLTDINGLKLQKKLQKILEDTKIILMVSREHDEVLLKIIKAGIMNYIMKDYNYMPLLKSILYYRHSSYPI